MNHFKKATSVALATLCLSVSLSSCATLFGGKVTEQQRRRPLPGEPQRQTRPVALIADILFWPSLIVDFSTGAIYKPERNRSIASPSAATAATSTRR